MIRKKVVLIVLFVAIIFWGCQSYGKEKVDDVDVIVDFSKDKGEATQRAVGFLHSISTTQPGPEYFEMLKPRTYRGPQSYPKELGWKVEGAFACYNRLKVMGVKIQVLLSDNYGYQVPEWDLGRGEVQGWPGDNNNWRGWENYIEKYVRQGLEKGYEIEWELWNEPDNKCFWNPEGDKKERFFDTWKVGVRKIREIDKDAVIVGPSCAYYHNKDFGFGVKEFLLYAKKHDVLPDVLTWHVWDQKNLVDNVVDVRKFMAQNDIEIERISINEIIDNDDKLKPAVAVWYFANIEEAKVDSACHACWQEQDKCYNCFNVTLDGLLTPYEFKPRSVWWTYKGYADITGELVDVTGNEKVNGVAGKDKNTKQCHVLLGKIAGERSEVNVQLKGLNDIGFLKSKNGNIRVIVDYIPHSGWDALEKPIVLKNEFVNYSNSIEVILPFFEVDDAYTISLQAE